MGVIEIGSKDEFDQYLQTHKTVIIDASASWCGPCKAISPFFDKHAAENDSIKDKVAFIRFDTDEIPDLAQELGIRSIPAFFVLEDGERVETLNGANPPALMKIVQNAVERSNGN
ncbi:thioredoxin trx1 [Fusarium irregulare]|uniref:Thioredoxin n=1 Tax=Fusarium irregulare TaxID=2494466 RepID=A0A9W8U6I8_9HYPO|nr:thioredoxin trx1 [Fusarium irregulare]KAJ4013361.1 thioredoxin trx1 [Fusarium irregulare]